MDRPIQSRPHAWEGRGRVSDIIDIIMGVGIGTVVMNLLVLGLNLKLYTEFAKQRMQEARKP